jgi:hypothetical protein
MEEKHYIWGGIIVWLVLFALTTSTSVFENLSAWWAYALFLVAPLFATVYGFLAVKKYTLGSTHGKTLFFFALGSLSWLIGEYLYIHLEWAGYAVYPNISDLFYLIAYPLFLIGAIIELREGKIDWSSTAVGVTSVSIASVLGIIGTVLTGYFGVILAYDAEAGLLTNLVNISYGIGDLILLFIVIMLIVKYAGAFFAQSWAILGLAFFMTWVADILYAVYFEAFENELFWTMQVDYLWTLSYIAIGYFFWRQITAIDALASA